MSSRARANNLEYLLREQLRLHRAGVPLAVMAGMVIGLLLVLACWGSVAPDVLAGWSATALGAGVFNLLVRRQHRRETLPGEDDAAWRKRYLAGTLARGLSWGLCSLMLWPAHDRALQMLVTVAVVVVCAITLAVLSFDRDASWAFALPALLPLLWRQAGNSGPVSLALTAMLLVLGVAMALLAQQAYRRARRNDALRQAEAERHAALQRSEQQLNDAEQVAALGSFDWNPVSGALHWSDQHYRLWGHELGAGTPGFTPNYRAFIERIHRDDLARVEQALQAALDGGRHYSCQHRVLWPDGSVREVQARGEVMFDGAGRAVRMIGTVQDITERLRADESLRTVEFAMNAMTDPVAVIDQDQVYRVVNDAWCAVNLRSREQTLGRSVPQIFPAVISPQRRMAIRDCIQHGRSAVVRSTSPSAGSIGRLIETRYLPFRDPHVVWHGVLMISRDITESAANEAALAASLDNLRLMLNATGDAIFASDARDPQQRVLFVNEQLLQLWNIPPEQAEQVTPALIIEHARPLFVDADREVARIAQVITSGAATEDRITLKDGRVLVRRCIPTVASGRQVRVWGFRDVTAEARAQSALSDSESRLRALLDAFPGYITAINTDYVYQYVNARVAALYERSPAQMVGQRVEDIVGPERARQIEQEVPRTLAGERVVIERRIAAAPGRAGLVMLVTMASGKGPHGEQLIYAFGTDITELKQTERALLAAKDEAESANRAKSQFLSNMSHELRTPMNAVLGFGQLLELNGPRNLTERQLQQVQEILRAGQHLLSLINDLLDLARIESGHVSVSLAPVDLPALIDECLRLTQGLAQRHGVTMAPAPVELGAASVQADRMRLKQVLLNLLANAIKYNRHDGQVSIHCRAMGSSHWRIEVNDTGLGLDEQAQSKLFQAFERLQADKTLVEGTGIGLALSRRLVQLMAGEIGMSSQVGVGSCFWVQLPRSHALPLTAGPDASQPALPAHLPAHQPAPPLPDMADAQGTVLCIDDNPVNLALLVALLEDRPGLQVVTSTAPLRGLALAQELRPDLVLLDIQLPDIDGLEVLRRLRHSADTAHIPVIAVSADAMPTMVERCLAAGFADYVTKPVDADRLLDAVDRELAGRSAPNPPALDPRAPDQQDSA